MLAAAAFATFFLTLDGGRPAAPQHVLVIAGRALLPIRSLGEALGAVVEYRPAHRTIVVRRAGRSAELMVGNRRMFVATVERTIDVAPQVVDGHAYVPLRAAADAIGIAATYDGATRTIALSTAPPTAALPAPASSPEHPALVTRRHPQPDGRIVDGYPAISALIEPQGGAPVLPAAIRLTVDGRDVSQLATIIGNEIVYTPQDALTSGTHAVRIAGVDRAGIPFAADWSFSTNYDVQSGSAAGAYGQGLTSVYIDRYLQFGERYFDVIAHGPPGGYGYVTIDDVLGSYQFYTQGIDRYVAHVTLPLGLDVPFAHAYVHFTGGTGNVVNYTLPSTLRLYTIQYASGCCSLGASATPTPHPTLDPAIVRRTIQTPPPSPLPAAPQASPSPSPPTHTRRPLSHPAPRIKPSAVPRSSDPS